MRTTLNVSDTLIRRAKLQAAAEQTSLTALVEDGLRLRLRQRESKPARQVSLPIYKAGGGLREGIDARSNASLHAAADE